MTGVSERSMSALKRIKVFLRNTMANERFSSLLSMAIEKTLLGEVAKDPIFTSSTVDEFGEGGKMVKCN